MQEGILDSRVYRGLAQTGEENEKKGRKEVRNIEKTFTEETNRSRSRIIYFGR